MLLSMPNADTLHTASYEISLEARVPRLLQFIRFRFMSWTVAEEL